MNKFRIRQFEIEDADYLCPRAIDTSIRNRPDYWKKWAAVNLESGPCYVGLLDDVPVIAAGLRIYEDHTGWVWAVFTYGIKKDLRVVLRAMKRFLGIWFEEFNLKELKVISRIKFPQSQTLLKHVGFTKQGWYNMYYYLFKREAV